MNIMYGIKSIFAHIVNIPASNRLADSEDRLTKIQEQLEKDGVDPYRTDCLLTAASLEKRQIEFLRGKIRKRRECLGLT